MTFSGESQEERAMNTQFQNPLNISRDEAIKLVGIGRTKFNELVHAGDIKVVRIGRRVLVPLEPLRAWLKSLEVAS
jgi:excisionase family DNA binding protein